ncbi:MAG: M48 family metallopeptidase [Pseudomonadota bacterium]
MTAIHPFTVVFLAFLIGGTAFRVWLGARQTRAMRSNRAAVPAPFDAQISLDDHQKAADYTAASTRLQMVDTIVDALLLVGWTLGGGIALLDRLWSAADLGPLVTGVAVIMSALLLMTVLALPASLYRTFGIEERFGFNKTTPGLFVSDTLKGLVLTALLGTPLLAVILWLMGQAGSLWWFYAWLVWTAFTLLMTWAYPTLISPLFNTFSPLDNPSMKSRIEALLERCGFRSKGIFVMDGSRRSAHGNAYFTGIGNNKRIVFFDTLIDTLDEGEVEAVLAHELGHFRKRHVRQRLIVSVFASLAGLASLGWLVERGWFYSALGVPTPSNHTALLLFLLAVPVFTFALTPLSAFWSRRHEFEADAYAAEQSNPDALIQALVKLYRDNATTLTPDPVHSGFYDSHPPAPVRVARLQQLAS